MVAGLAIVRRFGLGRRPVPDWLEDLSVVEPVHPLERCDLCRRQTSPRTAGRKEAQSGNADLMTE